MPVVRPLLAIALLAAAAASPAVTLIGLNSQNQLAWIDTANVGAATNVSLIGLAPGDRLVGIDTRPKDGLLYGITLSNQVVTVNPWSGAVSFVAALSTPVVTAGQGYGIDFNPVADAGSGPSLRFVSSSGNNHAVNASTGLVGNLTGSIAPGYTAVAYTNSQPLQAGPPAGTALYYLNSATDQLAMAPGSFNSPSISVVGPLGVDVLQANGFEILANGMAYAALNVDGSSLSTGLYGIDLATGTATLLGQYNGTLSGLTAVPVPEPQAALLLLAGLAGLGLKLRHRRA